MPPNGTAGLARSRVKGSRRDPRPPASTMAKTSRYTRRPPLDDPPGIESIHWHRGLLTIVRGNLSQANGFIRAHARKSGCHVACAARLAGSISSTSPGKVIIERDDYQSLFGALFNGGWQARSRMT